jgi:hypothetical protein
MNKTNAPTLVFTCEFDEQTAYESELKGWFEAVVVRLPNGLEVPLAFRDPVRLAQDLEAEQSAGRCCIAEPALIVIPKVTKALMTQAVMQLHDEGFFDRLVAIGVKKPRTESR